MASGNKINRFVRRFAASLRVQFRREIERDPARFKRSVIRALRHELPPQPGRPCSHVVTRAFRLRARKTPWPKIYRACLPIDSDQRARFNLRVAVRMRRLRFTTRHGQGKQNRQPNVCLEPSRAVAASCLRKE